MTSWLARYFFGTWAPALDAEYRARPADESVRASVLAPLLKDLHAHPREFERVQQPALAVCALATVTSEFPWLTPNSARYDEAQRYIQEERRPFQAEECARFGAEAGNRSTSAVEGHHYIFIARQDAVVRAMRSFLHS